MLSINTIARVVVNTIRTSASPASFDTGLLLIRDPEYTAARRLNAYTSGAEAAAALADLLLIRLDDLQKVVCCFVHLFRCLP